MGPVPIICPEMRQRGLIEPVIAWVGVLNGLVSCVFARLDVVGAVILSLGRQHGANREG